MKKIFIIAIMASVLLPFNYVKAQSSGLLISPPIKEYDLDKGAKVNDNIKVTNPTPNDFDVEITVQNFKALGEDGAQEYLEDNAIPLASWINVKDKKVNIKSNQEKEISYEINIPDNAAVGGHYATIFFTPKSLTNETKGSGAVVVPKIGSLVLVNVKGQAQEQASLLTFSANKFNKYLNGSIDFATRIENTGNTHIKPTGNIAIKNILGKEITTINFNEKNSNILPDSIRKFDNVWNYKTKFGYYKAQLNITYGKSGTITSTINFVIFPAKEVAIGAGALIFILIIAGLVRRKKINQNLA